MLIKVRTLTGKEIELDLIASSTPATGSNDAEMKDAGEEAAEAEAAGAGEEAQKDEFQDPMEILVSHIKEKIEEKEGIPPDQQRLIHRGKQLQPNWTLREAEIEPGATLHLVLALRGGR